MKLAWCHRWDLTPAMARQLQHEARHRVILRNQRGALALPRRVMAVDVGYDKHEDVCAASLVVWDTVGEKSLFEATHTQGSTFPYVPGLLSFREIPPLLPLIQRLRRRPALILCDGQGIAHPRRMGLACHLGLVLDCPTVGWAKSRLTGACGPLGPERGAATELLDGPEQIGWVLRSRAGCRPTYVSPGHRVSLKHSLEIARALMGRYRLCEPARAAHCLTRRALQRLGQNQMDS